MGLVAEIKSIVCDACGFDFRDDTPGTYIHPGCSKSDADDGNSVTVVASPEATETEQEPAAPAAEAAEGDGSTEETPAEPEATA